MVIQLKPAGTFARMPTVFAPTIKELKMPIRLVLIVVLVAFFAGCADKPEVVAEPDAPPPPTPREIADKFLTASRLNGPPPSPGTPLPPGAAKKLVGQVKNFAKVNSKTPEGKGAVTIVARKVNELITACEGGNLWEWALVYIDADSALNPGSEKWASTRERAILALKKPKVTIKGLTEVLGEKVVLLDFALRAERKHYSERLRIGDEMHGLKFIKVVGRDRGIIMEYIETGETFEVMMGSSR